MALPHSTLDHRQAPFWQSAGTFVLYPVALLLRHIPFFFLCTVGLQGRHCIYCHAALSPADVYLYQYPFEAYLVSDTWTEEVGFLKNVRFMVVWVEDGGLECCRKDI